MYGCEANAKHMILAEETTKYLGDNEGVLNVQLMMKLLQVVAYNLAKSRAAQDGNKLKRKNFRPRHIQGKTTQYSQETTLQSHLKQKVPITYV